MKAFELYLGCWSETGQDFRAQRGFEQQMQAGESKDKLTCQLLPLGQCGWTDSCIRNYHFPVDALICFQCFSSYSKSCSRRRSKINMVFETITHGSWEPGAKSHNSHHLKIGVFNVSDAEHGSFVLATSESWILAIGSIVYNDLIRFNFQKITFKKFYLRKLNIFYVC